MFSTLEITQPTNPPLSTTELFRTQTGVSGSSYPSGAGKTLTTTNPPKSSVPLYNLTITSVADQSSTPPLSKSQPGRKKTKERKKKKLGSNTEEPTGVQWVNEVTKPTNVQHTPALVLLEKFNLSNKGNQYNNHNNPLMMDSDNYSEKSEKELSEKSFLLVERNNYGDKNLINEWDWGKGKVKDKFNKTQKKMKEYFILRLYAELPEVDPNTCTWMVTGDNCFLQRGFQCFDCYPDIENWICSSCIRLCHKDHKVSESTASRFSCYCGASSDTLCKCCNDNTVLPLDENKEQVSAKLHVQITEKWSRPLSECSVGQDLPRLGPKHEIYDKNSLRIFPRSCPCPVAPVPLKKITHTKRELPPIPPKRSNNPNPRPLPDIPYIHTNHSNIHANTLTKLPPVRFLPPTPVQVHSPPSQSPPSAGLSDSPSQSRNPTALKITPFISLPEIPGMIEGGSIPNQGLPSRSTGNSKEEIVSKINKQVDQSDYSPQPFDIVRDLFYTISEQFGIIDVYYSTFANHFSAFISGKSPEDKKDLLRLSKEYVQLLGTDNCTVKLLKASCSQGIVSPAWVYLNLFLLKDFPFKDVKLGWSVYVFFTPQKITVIHRKKEQGHNEELDLDEFSFTWELKLVFDPKMTQLKSSHFAITELQISPQMDPDRSTKLKNRLRPWREPTYLPSLGDSSRPRSKSLGHRTTNIRSPHSRYL